MHQSALHKPLPDGPVRVLHTVSDARVVLASVIVRYLTVQPRLAPAVGRVKLRLLLDVVLRLLLAAVSLLLIAFVVVATQLLRRRKLRPLLWVALWLLAELLVAVLPVELPVALADTVVQLLTCRTLPQRL